MVRLTFFEEYKKKTVVSSLVYLIKVSGNNFCVCFRIYAQNVKLVLMPVRYMSNCMTVYHNITSFNSYSLGNRRS